MSDSRISTYRHIQVVQEMLGICISELQRRQLRHDRSKLSSPEVEYFDEYEPRLANSTYMSDEYKEFLAGMGPGLDHHYANNDHHPEFYKDGYIGMNLISLLEMIVDWNAAALKHKNGNIFTSIENNQKRFGYSDELKQILINTVKDFLEPTNATV